MDLIANIDVDDLEKGIEFYRAGLGLRLGRRFGDGFAEMLGGSAAILLLAKPSGTPPYAGASQRRDYRRHWTPVHLDFVVDDVDAAAARAKAAGAAREGETETHAWGRIAFMSDPFGHGFCLLHFLGRGYDELR